MEPDSNQQSKTCMNREREKRQASQEQPDKGNQQRNVQQKSKKNIVAVSHRKPKPEVIVRMVCVFASQNPPHYFSPIDTQPHPVSVRKPHPSEIPGTSSVATDNETQEKRPRANVPGTKSGTYKAYNIYIEPVRYSLSQHDIFQSSNVCLSSRLLGSRVVSDTSGVPFGAKADLLIRPCMYVNLPGSRSGSFALRRA